jgi:Virulence factor BrkB
LGAIAFARGNRRADYWAGRRRGKRPATGAFGTTRSTDEPRELQYERAHETGRGRQATAPWQIPWAGWKDILWRTYQQINQDRLLAVAAGVVFYGLLALFPAVTAVVSLYGLFTKPSTISEHLSLLASFLPSGGMDIVQEQVNRLLSKGDAKLGLGFLFGLCLALWSANAGMKAIMDALNVVYEEKEKRSMGTWNSRRRIISFVTHDGQKSLRCMRSYGCVRVSLPLRPDDCVGHAATFPVSWQRDFEPPPCSGLLALSRAGQRMATTSSWACPPRSACADIRHAWRWRSEGQDRVASRTGKASIHHRACKRNSGSRSRHSTFPQDGAHGCGTESRPGDWDGCDT